MKYIITETDRDILNKHISEAEEKTNAQIVLATIRRCDNYAEVPWKAFAIGSSLSGLVVFLVDLIIFRWTTDTIILFAIAAIMITGALLSLLTVILPCFAGLLIPKCRKETETLQYAESLFLSRELFATDGRRGILLLISCFERQVVIIRDKGVLAHLNDDKMKKIISEMTPFLKKNEIRNALETGLNGIVEAICPPLPEGMDKNELSNEIIEEEGE
jgi:putative membrane protein